MLFMYTYYLNESFNALPNYNMASVRHVLICISNRESVM